VKKSETQDNSEAVISLDNRVKVTAR